MDDVARDFGRVVEAKPASVVTATTEEEAVRALAAAAEARLEVALQGTGHSLGGQSLTEGGVLVRNRIIGPLRWCSSTEVEVPSGTHWTAVEDEANRRGLAVPVIQDYTALSVGGSVSVGGGGVDSPVHGLQVDHVTGFRLLAPDGRSHWCAPDSNPDLFRFALAGLGQLGLITSVRVRLRPVRRRSVHCGYAYPSLAALAGSMEWITAEPAGLRAGFRGVAFGADSEAVAWYSEEVETEGEDVLGQVRRHAGPPHEIDSRSWSRRLDHASITRFIDAHGPRCRRLWVDYGFGYRQFAEFCRYVDDVVRPGASGPHLHSVYAAVLAPSPQGPGYFPLDMRPPAEAPTFTCGLYYMVPETDDLRCVEQVLADCLAVAHRLGGRPYGYGYYERDESRWRQAFGNQAIDTLADLKRRLDPHGLIRPSWQPPTAAR